MISNKRTKSFLNGKNAIGAVVSVALLLVVAVVGVVTFQGWFTTYFSDLQTDIETQSTGGVDTRIERVIDETLYFRNGGSENISITDIEVEGVSCNISQEISSGTQEVDIENCLSNLSTSTPEVVVYTDNSIYSEQIFVDSVSSSSEGGNESGGGGNSFSQNCSSLPGNWSAVPGNANLGTEDFCVMTYEAKDVSGTATSQPSQTPWVSINQTDARQACTDLGEGYSLITDPQWVTMARNAESQSQNWNTSTVGDGFMWTGHNDNDPGNALDVSNPNNPYDQTGDSNNGTCDGSSDSWASGSSYACEGQKRTLELSTGDIVWDVGGNVWEWTNDTIEEPDSGLGVESGSAGWHEWPEVNRSNYGYLQPFNSTFDYTNGVGRVYADDNGAYPSGTTHAFRRGGYWNDGVYAGAFALHLSNAPSNSAALIGFRCSYTN